MGCMMVTAEAMAWDASAATPSAYPPTPCTTSATLATASELRYATI